MRISTRLTAALLAVYAAGPAANGQPPPAPSKTEPVFVASPKPAPPEILGTSARVVPAAAAVPAIDVPRTDAGSPTPAARVLPETMDPTPVAPGPAGAPEEIDPRGADGGKDGTAPGPTQNPLYDSLHDDDQYGLKSLFDSLHPQGGKKSHWYDKLSIRGYSQIRLGRSVGQNPNGADPTLFGDRSINGNAENFSIRRARLILFGDLSDYASLYFQTDFANNPADATTNTFFAQIRDLYADVYLDRERINRFRIGQSKLPWGFEEMQSSGNRVPLDRSDAIDTGDAPNQRDLGVFYYWTPVDKQTLLKELVEGGLKGTGNYGVFALGVYNGQGGGQLEQNLNLHTVARFTWPFRLANGQVVEVSLQGYTGQVVVPGAEIRPLGVGPAITPAGAGGHSGLRDQRLAGTFVWYPQPFGLQAEWNVGESPGLNDAQTALEVRPLHGGYVMLTCKLDTARHGIFIPFARYQHYHGSYRSIANAPYGKHDQFSLGVEWQIRKEMELVVEYDIVDGMNLNAIDSPGAVSYRTYRGEVLRCQFQINY